MLRHFVVVVGPVSVDIDRYGVFPCFCVVVGRVSVDIDRYGVFSLFLWF